MRSLRHAAVGCALLLVSGCATAEPTGLPAAARPSSAGAAAPAAPADAPQMIAGFGTTHRFPGGLCVVVSTPRSFKPSPTAYPSAPRAAALEFSVRNDGTELYRLSSLSVNATTGDADAKQVVDSTQGFTGIVEADKDLRPGRTVRFTLAFAMPAEPADLRLTLRPTANATPAVVYAGPA